MTVAAAAHYPARDLYCYIMVPHVIFSLCKGLPAGQEVPYVFKLKNFDGGMMHCTSDCA